MVFSWYFKTTSGIPTWFGFIFELLSPSLWTLIPSQLIEFGPKSPRSIKMTTLSKIYFWNVRDLFCKKSQRHASRATGFKPWTSGSQWLIISLSKKTKLLKRFFFDKLTINSIIDGKRPAEFSTKFSDNACFDVQIFMIWHFRSK